VKNEEKLEIINSVINTEFNNKYGVNIVIIVLLIVILLTIGCSRNYTGFNFKGATDICCSSHINIGIIIINNAIVTIVSQITNYDT
jgi:hypothetical protein